MSAKDVLVPFNVLSNAIGVTSTDALSAVNNTAATNGNPQWSPRVRMKGQKWSTVDTASYSVHFCQEVKTTSGATGEGSWTLSSSLNGTSWTPRLSVDESTGLVKILTAGIGLSLPGATSGTAQIKAPAVAGSAVLTLPDKTATLATLAVTALVATSQTTTSATYADLATSGPAVTRVTGTKVLVTLSCKLSNAGAGQWALMGVAVSGATTTAAADTASLLNGIGGGTPLAMSVTFPLTVTAGSNTFTAKYRVTANTGTFSDRSITVVDAE